jgi:hypothetical protein
MSKFDLVSELIEKSQFTVIGYLPECYLTKDKLLKSMGYTDYGKFSTDLDLVSIIRSKKIDGILQPDHVDNKFYFDISNLEIPKPLTPEKDSFNRSATIRSFSQKLRIQSNKQKIIITSLIYNSPNGWDMSGGNSLTYVADLILHIVPISGNVPPSDQIKVYKNRHGLERNFIEDRHDNWILEK